MNESPIDDRARTASRDAAATSWSRRRFLFTVAASGALVACAGSDDGDSTVLPNGETSADGSGGATSGAVDGVDTVVDGFSLAKRFPNDVQVPGVVRLPISLSTGAAEIIQYGPAQLGAQVVDIDGAPLGDRITAVKREVAPAPYYDFRTTIEVPGVYALVVDGGPPTGAAFQVFDPGAVAVPTPGQLLPGFDTPTTGDPQGFDTICTLTPEPCPFHSITLAEALDVGRPVAYCVGTPAFCQTGSCAPGLEALIAASQRFGDDFVFVHAEVFSDDAGTEIAPAVTALGMTFEPALFLTDADGVLQERLDAVWNQTELEEALARIVG